MSKVITVTGISILALALALVLGMAVPALAAPNSAPSWVGDLEGELIRGEVVSIGDQEFAIQSGEEELTIAVADDTRYYQISTPGTSARQRLQLHQQNQLEIRARVGHCHGWGRQNRVQAETAARNQLRLQNQLAQTEGAPRGLYWLRGFCPFGGQAEFADIAVGDSVVVLFGENNLARVVLIIKPTA